MIMSDNAKRNGRRTRSGKKARRRKTLLAAAAVIFFAAVIVLTVFFLNKNSESGDGLEGLWSLDEVTSYEFDGRGSGVLHTSMNKYAFSYETDGETVKIDFESEAAKDCEYAYSVKNGKLTLTDSFNTVYVLKKHN